MTEQSSRLAQVRQIGISYANSERFHRHGALKIYCRACSNYGELIKRVEEVLNLQKRVCFVNIQLSVILQSVSTKNFSLFYPSTNSDLLKTQFRITKNADKSKLIEILKNFDIESHLYYPGSEYVFSEISHVRILVNSDDSLPLGCACKQDLDKLPPNLLKNQNITCKFKRRSRVTVGRNTRKVCNACDKLCFFHSLSCYFRKVLKMNKLADGTLTTALGLFRLYCIDQNIDPRTFPGIRMSEFDYFENYYSLRINIYLYKGPKGAYHVRAEELRLSDLENAQNGTLNLLRVGEHIVFVKGSIYAILGYLVCPLCFGHIKNRNHFIRHVRLCSKRTQAGLHGESSKVFWSGQQFLPKRNLFEVIEYFCGKENFPSPSIWENYYLACLDSECSYESFESRPIQRGKGTTTLARLRFLVCGVTSNIQGFDSPKLFWDTPSFGDDLVRYLVDMSNKQSELLKLQFAPAFRILEQKLECAEQANRKDTVKLFTKLIEKLNKYCNCVRILTYNGARFDNKLLKSRLLGAIVKYYGNKTNSLRVLMKDNTYVMINCQNFSILDQINYSFYAKMSYDDFVFTVLGERGKSVFPYEFLTSASLLDNTELPTRVEDWYSRLKQISILDCDYLKFADKLAVSPAGTSPEDVARSLGYSKIPSRGAERLRELQQEFKESGCRTLRCWLSRYLIQDLDPFLRACVRLGKAFYKQFGRLLYMYPSVPSVAITVAFRDYLCKAGCEVYTPSKLLYSSILEKTPAGLSVIFNMETVAGRTKIREDEFGALSRLTQNIFSLDASK